MHVIRYWQLMVVRSGHDPAKNDPLAKIPELARHRMEKGAQILGMLREGTNDVDALVARIYGETDERLGSWPDTKWWLTSRSWRRMGRQ